MAKSYKLEILQGD